MNLTREQIEAMRAGREMDALVGEVVMGLQVCRDTECPGCDAPFAVEADGRIAQQGTYQNDGPAYSTDITAAWDVAWQVAPPGAMFRLLRQRTSTTFECIVDYDTAAVGDTAPLAICRAALLWALTNQPNQETQP